MTEQSIDQEMKEIFMNGNVSRKYFVINKDGTLKKVAVSKVDKNLLDNNISDSKSEFEIFEATYLSVAGNIRCLISTRIYQVALNGAESVGLKDSKNYMPSENQFKILLRTLFKEYLFFYLNERLAVKYNATRKIRSSDLDKLFKSCDKHDDAKTNSEILANVFKHVDEDNKVEELRDLKELYAREKSFGYTVDFEIDEKLMFFFERNEAGAA